MKPLHRSDDERPCALLFRKKPGEAWELHCHTLSVSVAWRSADMLLHELIRGDGVKSAQVAVMLRALYDEGRGTPLVPPSGFEHLDLTRQRIRRNLSVKTKPPADLESDEDTGLGAIDTDMDF